MTICLALTVRADQVESEDEIDEVMVLGTRLSTVIPQTVETVDAEQIETLQPLTVTNILRTLPGITAIEPGGAGGVTEVYLRGADANFTNVYINGILQNDSTDARGGGFDFSSLLPGDIHRIEVVRGPFSALYGSGALAGAISINTRTPRTEQFTSDLDASIGTSGYWHLGGGIYGPVASGYAGIRLSHIDFGEATPGSTREVTSLGGNINNDLTENLSVDFTFRAVDRDRTSYPVASGGPRLAELGLLEYSDSSEFSSGVRLDWQGENHSVSVFASYLGRQEFTDTPPIPEGVFSSVPASITDTDLDRFTLSLQIQVQVNEKFEMSAGLEFQHENGTSEGSLDFGFPLPTGFDYSRKTISPYAEGRVEFGRGSTLFAGIRYDHFTDVESALSPRIGYAWQQGQQGVKFNASWGKGRKAPSLYALGDSLIGNPDLKPEDSEGWEIEVAVPFHSESTILSVSVYQTDYSNLIDFDFATFQLVNRSVVATRGAELRLQSEISQQLSWSVFVATHKNKVENIKNALLHRPELTAGGRLNWQLSERVYVHATARYEGDRPSSSIPGGYETLDSFTRFDIASGFQLTESVEFHLMVDNVFNKYYESVAGFESPGRQFRVSVKRVF